VELANIEGGPWKEYGRSGKPISTRRLRTLLKPLKIHPGPNKAGDARGYYKAQFEDAFERYLERVSPPKAVFDDLSVRSVRNLDEMGTSDHVQSVGNGGVSDTLKTPGNADDMGISDTSDTLKGETATRGTDLGAGGPGLSQAYEVPPVKVPELPPDTLDERGARLETHTSPSTNGEPGLSRRRIQQLVDWYADEEYRRRHEGRLDAAELDADLRAVLQDEVFPEDVEIEFERVLRAASGGI
jgi:hypothetical protein